MLRRPVAVPLIVALLGLVSLGVAAVTNPAPFASTYLGGSDTDMGWAVDVGPDGFLYAAGTTSSTQFPGTTGVPRNGDVFVSKMTADGRTLVWTRVMGGTLYEFPTGIRAATGGVYIAGTTASLDYPTTAGAVDRTFAGPNEGFLTKLDPADGATVWSTFLGGGGYDEIGDLSFSPGGHVVVAGATESCDFPTSADAAQKPPTGCSDYSGDAFVAKFGPDGALNRSSVFGGSGRDRAIGLAVDGVEGLITITGDTTSTNLPMVGAPYQTRPDQVFVARLTSRLDAVSWSTYLGGASGPETAGDVAVNRAGDVYVTGGTRSTDFPTTAGAHRTVHQSPSQCGEGNPCDDAFVVKLRASGSSLAWSTFLGGEANDAGVALGLGNDESAWVAGPSQSTEHFLPANAGGGFNDGFLAVLEPGGNALRHLAALGGTDWDEAFDLRVVSGQAWATGFTYSDDFPTTLGAFDGTANGADDAFLVGFDADPTPPRLAFDHKAGNEWWVEVTVTGATIGAVEARDDGGPWAPLTLRDWGAWAGSFHIEPGHKVQFRAFSQAQWVESCLFTHPAGEPQCPNDFQASFLNVRGNEWWIETEVSANQALAKVEVKRNGGAPVAMDATGWGSWAKSLHAPSGTVVQFVAHGTSGALVSSSCYRWTDITPTSCATSTPTPPPPPPPPVFDHKTGGNEWWVEVVVSQQTPSRVQSMDAGGPWTEMTAKYGAWGASYRIEPGHDVRFRALVGSTWYESCWFTHAAGNARTGGTTCAGTAN